MTNTNIVGNKRYLSNSYRVSNISQTFDKQLMGIYGDVEKYQKWDEVNSLDLINYCYDYDDCTLTNTVSNGYFNYLHLSNAANYFSYLRTVRMYLTNITLYVVLYRTLFSQKIPKKSYFYFTHFFSNIKKII